MGTLYTFNKKVMEAVFSMVLNKDQVYTVPNRSSLQIDKIMIPMHNFDVSSDDTIEICIAGKEPLVSYLWMFPIITLYDGYFRIIDITNTPIFIDSFQQYSYKSNNLETQTKNFIRVFGKVFTIYPREVQP